MTTYVNPGLDASGNGNNWTTNNINWTSSGVTFDTMTDVPTNTSATTANYCVWNEIDPNKEVYTNGNLSLSGSLTLTRLAKGTIASSSGKFYWEYTITSTSSTFFLVGIAGLSATASGGGANSGNSVFYRHDNGDKVINGVSSAYGATWTTGDVIGVALDLDSNTVVFYKNNSSQGSISITADTYTPAVITNQPSHQLALNCGQRPFAYTPPANYVALNTYNLPTPTIGATASSQAGDYFNIALYSGNSANPRSISGVGLQPDFVWVKQRSSNGGGFGDHQLYDSVRGTQKLLRSNTTNAELANPSNGGVQSFDSDGFTIQGSSASLNMNATGETYVAWNWRASNATGVTNTAGSITSTVSANTSSGFSVVTYTGNGSAGATFGHGLGVAPSMVIIKDRVDGVADWRCYHVSLGNTKGIFLNLANAAGTDSSYWNNTTPSSTVVTLGTNIYLNASGHTYVAYCFAAVAGYSAFGSYTGNGSTDGPFIYTGFRPKYVLWKNATSSGESWLVLDSARNPYNAANSRLYPDQAYAEDTGNSTDFLSNGFKLRTSGSNQNNNGSTIIYAAFAESPFKYANAR